MPRAKALADGLFPGVNFTTQLRTLNAIDLMGRYTYFMDRDPIALRVDLGWKIVTAAGDVYVTVWFFALARGNRWPVTQYSMHFGPAPRRAFYFRVCDNPQREPHHHFHHYLHPNAFVKGHIPAANSSPRIPATADPGWFLGILKTFLQTNTVSIGVIP